MGLEKELKVGLDFAAPIPLHTDLHSEKFEGFEVDLMTEIAKELKLTLTYKVSYWKDIIADLVAGKIDVICSAATVTEERKEYVAFSRTYLRFHLALVSNKGNRLSLTELKDKRIGVRKSTEAEDYLKHKFPGKQLFFYDTNDEQYEKLSTKDIDAVVDDGPIAYGFTSKSSVLAISEIIDGTSSEYAIIINKENIDLQKKINTVIDKLEENGFLKATRIRWFEDAPL